MPDTHRGKWELAQDLLTSSRDILRDFAADGHGPEEQGAREMADDLQLVIEALNGPRLLGYKPQS